MTIRESEEIATRWLLNRRLSPGLAKSLGELLILVDSTGRAAGMAEERERGADSIVAAAARVEGALDALAGKIR